MSSLPPYSTYRTDSKQMMYPQATSHGNILTFTPPSFSQQLNVKFPDSRLAVCAKCKKNFKTRDMCRVRNGHTTPPWTTAFVCITIDASCLDENGKFVDKPMTVRMVQWQPYCVMKPFDSKTPVCAAYVADPSTVVAGASQKVEDVNGDGKPPSSSTSEKVKKEAGVGVGVGSDEIETAGNPTEPSETTHTTNADATTNAGDNEDPGDDINDINENRTFLAKVSSRSITIHWLDLAEYDSSEAAPFPGTVPVDAQQQYHAVMAQIPPHPMDPNQPPSQQYYQQNMNYAAQQHQNALKSRQQYFFQMQQQHPYPMPPGVPGMQPGHWQQAPYAMAVPGQAGELPAGATAGEAAAAQLRRGPPGSPDDVQQQFQHPHQHWASMYYQTPTGLQYLAPPPELDGTIKVSTPGELDGSNQSGENETYHTPPESTNGDDAQDDNKRQRTV